MKAIEWMIKNSDKISKNKRVLIVSECAKACGCTERTAYRAFKMTASKRMSSTYKTINHFKSSFDPVHKIQEVINALPDDGYITEHELCDMADIGAYKLSRYKDMFTNNFIGIRDGGRLAFFWAKNKMIKEMRKAIS